MGLEKQLNEFSSKGWSRSGFNSLLRAEDELMQEAPLTRKLLGAYLFGPPCTIKLYGVVCERCFYDYCMEL